MITVDNAEVDPKVVELSREQEQRIVREITQKVVNLLQEQEQRIVTKITNNVIGFIKEQNAAEHREAHYFAGRR